ncbi:DUF1365 domain-containing protein [Pelagibacteraceae bacterium]|jgi:DUF1365 family protein|nr:DUF1365 domain-containing protein [Pelagibacteraceae bacterium]
METCIYKGFVTHRRFKPLRHYFSYKTFSILFDLTELKDLHKKISIFSFNRFNIFSFYNKDHGSRDGSDLSEWVKKNLKKYNLNFNISKVKLLCFPRIFGYVFNPLSIFYCYDGKILKAILYEVKNTFDEQHTYVFSVNNSSKIITQKCDKKFYVSPFIEMNTFYNFRLTEPDENIRILIKQTDKKGKVLVACQVGIKQIMSFKHLLINFFTHPMMTFKIMISIHYEALRLWKKGAIFQKRQIKVKNNTSLEK